MSSCVKLQETTNWTLFVTAFQSNNWSRNKWRSARQAVVESDQRVQLPGVVNEKRSNGCFMFSPYVLYENDLKRCVLFMLINRILSWWKSINRFLSAWWTSKLIFGIHTSRGDSGLTQQLTSVSKEVVPRGFTWSLRRFIENMWNKQLRQKHHPI